LFIIAVAFAATLGYAFETKPLVTTTSVKTITLTTSNKVQSETITEQIIGVFSPETVTVTYEVEGPNCTIPLPAPIIGYNTTEFILPSGGLNSTFSIVSTSTTFSQMPTPPTTYTTITESINSTNTAGNSTVMTFSCPTIIE